MLRKCCLALCCFFMGSPLAMSQDPWPQFRGKYAGGVTLNQNLPLSWDAEKDHNIAWKTPLPGQSYACPIVWGNQVFIVTAIKSLGGQAFHEELLENEHLKDEPLNHRWEVWSMDMQTGKVLWQKVASSFSDPTRQKPVVYNHSTPATDGKVVVATFGDQGIHAFDMSGKKLWSKALNSPSPAYQGQNQAWVPNSSPIIYEGRIYLQLDKPEIQYLIALDSQTGKEVWRANRDDLPSWGTPTFVPGTPNEIVTNGAHFIRSYHAATGKELWRVPASGIRDPTPTPIFTKDLFLVTSGKRQPKPIQAIKRGLRGDLSAAKTEGSPSGVLWEKQGRGPHLPTPIIVGDLLYNIHDDGILACYEIATGAEVYRVRGPMSGNVFTASPVAADGRIYLSSLHGEIYVVAAGRDFKVTAVNNMHEEIKATPAIAQGHLFVRTHNHLFAIRKQ